jgi:hypothetical protein
VSTPRIDNYAENSPDYPQQTSLMKKHTGKEQVLSNFLNMALPKLLDPVSATLLNILFAIEIHNIYQ